MTIIFGGILPYEAEVAEPDGPRIAAWVLADYADRADAIFQKWLAKHDAEVAAKALRDFASASNTSEFHIEVLLGGSDYVRHVLRDRADEIEKGGQP